MDDNKQDPIANSLGLVPMHPVNQPVALPASNDEYDKAKGNVENVMQVGTEALNKMMDIADLSQSSRDYRVVSEMMSVMIQASKTMMDIKKDNIAVKQAEEKQQDVQVTNQTNVYISPSELLDIIANKE